MRVFYLTAGVVEEHQHSYYLLFTRRDRFVNGLRNGDGKLRSDWPFITYSKKLNLSKETRPSLT